MAEYREDFYAGRPALTVNAFGKGKAYYLAARAKEPFYADFYGQLIQEAGVSRVIDTELPSGVTAQMHTDGENDYVFLLNFSGQALEIGLAGQAFTDLFSGRAEQAAVHLDVHGLRLLKRAKAGRS
ncbi:beta-galactosidase trimerization domain-containing protein [Paenibacillus chibensis]|uniref:beta-galactosidase trimerization domain-containing protein n=1 Tax=Paenibacillus chibensis TaxID=59846 RepID=UPI00399C59E9